MKKWVLVLACISLFGCRLLSPSSTIESAATSSQLVEQPTATPYPTFTPYPSPTPYPSNTPTPTLAPTNTPSPTSPTSSRIKMGLLDYNGAEYYLTYDPSVWVSGKIYDYPALAQKQDLDCQIINHMGSGISGEYEQDTTSQNIGGHDYSISTWSWYEVIQLRVYAYDEHIAIQVRPGHDREICIRDAEKVLELSQSTFYNP